MPDSLSNEKEIEQKINELVGKITNLKDEFNENNLDDTIYHGQLLDLSSRLNKLLTKPGLKEPDKGIIIDETDTKLPPLPNIPDIGMKPVELPDNINHVPPPRNVKHTEMKLIDTIEVPTSEPKSIQLLLGDLTNIPEEHAVDILIISAFQDDYYPVPGTLIHALYESGISIKELATDKKYDYRDELSCWLTNKIESDRPGIQFDHILVFEAFITGHPSEMVGDVFRALFPFLSQDMNKVATSLISTGGSGADREVMMTQLLEAAYHWMNNGLDMSEFKIVIYNEATLDIVKPIFQAKKAEFSNILPQRRPSNYLHDVFISYSHRNTTHADTIFNKLKEINTSLSIFIDKLELNPGNSWQQELFQALEKSEVILALISPDYLNSKVCIEEFDIAMMRNRDADEQILYPLLITETNLPYYMQMIQFLDVRDSDPENVKMILQKIIDNQPASHQVVAETISSTQTEHRETAELSNSTILQMIDNLKKVYGNKLPLKRLAEKLEVKFDYLLDKLENMIIEDLIEARIDSMETSESDDDFLNLL